MSMLLHQVMGILPNQIQSQLKKYGLLKGNTLSQQNNKYRISNVLYKISTNLEKITKETNFIVDKSNRKDISKSDLIILHGGEDISPTIYGEETLQATGASNEVSLRDQKELWAIYEAIESEVPILGICRGAQLLCAVSGGKLFQHVTGHQSGHHEITTVDGTSFQVTSAHHQMMDTRNTNHSLLAWSTKKLSAGYLTPEYKENSEENFEPEFEPEIVYFPEIKALAIQSHPEWENPKSDFISYYQQLVTNLIEGKL